MNTNNIQEVKELRKYVYNKRNVTTDIRFDSIDHLPTVIDDETLSVRQRCKLCSKKASWKCIKCKVPLCMIPGRCTSFLVFNLIKIEYNTLNTVFIDK